MLVGGLPMIRSYFFWCGSSGAEQQKSSHQTTGARNIGGHLLRCVQLVSLPTGGSSDSNNIMTYITCLSHMLLSVGSFEVYLM